MPSSLRVLYVDDEPGLLEIGKLFLEERGDVFVTIIDSALAALDLLQQEKFDAIVSDYQMPGMDGIQFLIEVRTKLGHIPFVLFTGKGREEIVIKALNEGADFYLQKGGDPESQFAELTHKIRRAVYNRESEERLIIQNRLYSVLSATNKAIVHIRDKEVFFNEICRILVEIGGFRMVWIGLADLECKIIRPVASAGHVDGYLDNINISIADIPHGRGPTGTAFREGKYYFSNEFSQDPHMEPWRENALKHGYRANAAFPFALGTQNAGVLTLYAPVTGFFDDGVVGLLEEISHEISFAIKTLDQEMQKKSAEEALRKQSEQLRSLINSMPDIVCFKDGEGRWLEANDFDLHLFQLDGVPYQGKKDSELAEYSSFYRDAFLACESSDEETWNNKALTRCEESIPRPNGTVMIFDVIKVPIFNEDGSRKGLVVIGRDITERKRVGEAQRESEEAFRSLAESSPDYIMRYDQQCRHIYMNPAALMVAGLTEKQIIGKTHRESGFDETQSQFWEEKITGVFETGKPYNTQFKWESIEGPVFLDWMLTPEFSEGGTVQSVLGVSRDITQLKKTEEDLLKKNKELTASYEHLAAAGEELRSNLEEMTKAQRELHESEEALSAMLNAITESALMMTPKGTVLAANETVARRLGQKSADNLIGKNVFDLIPDDIQKKRQKRVNEVLQSGLPAHFEDVRNGRVINQTIYPVKSPRGTVDRLTIFGIDITERNMVEEALRESNKKLNILFGVTHQDVNRQLSILSENIRILQSKQPDIAKEQYFQKISGAVRKISGLVKFTSEYERIGVNKSVWLECHRLIETAAKQAPLGKVKIKNDIPVGMEIFADPMIIKVFINLMENAVRFGGNITNIRFSSVESGVNYLIVCEDDGVGIPTAEKTKIFEQGFGKNSGFGLFLSREILSITGITIRETGEAEKGARFEIIVPNENCRIYNENNSEV